ncbi:hypothetical protein D3C86_1451970 [compost metagenome]
MVTEQFVTGAELQVGQRILSRHLTAESPVINPCVERRQADSGLTDAAPGIAFGRAMRRRRGHRRMPEPDCLVFPTSHLGRGFQGAAKQRPLRTEFLAVFVLEIGGDVPPFNTKTVVGAVIRRKAELPTGNDRREGRRLVAQPREAFFRWRRLIAAAQRQHQQPHGELNPHGQTSSASPPVACDTTNTTAMPKPATSPPAPTPSTAIVATETPAAAGASRTPGR